MKNGRTIDEWNTTAMLLGPGWWYDWHDHTICFDHAINGKAGVDIYEPETMEKLNWMAHLPSQRAEAVRSGEIGASDAKDYIKELRQKMSDNGQAVTSEGNTT